MRRILVLLTGLTVAVATQAVALPANASAPGIPVWLSDSGASFTITTTATGWRLVGGGAPRVVQQYSAPKPTATEPGEKQGTALLWAPKCSKGVQAVHLRRTFSLAGPLGKFGLQLSSAGFLGKTLVLVNGKAAFAAAHPSGGSSDTGKGGLLKFGNNVIDLIVSKPAGACPRGNKLGVAASFTGEFAADLALTSTVKPDQFYDQSTAKHSILTINVPMANLGPGGMARGHYDFSLNSVNISDPATTFELPTPQRPFGQCVDHPSNNGHTHDVSCPFTDWEAAPTRPINLVFKYGFVIPDSNSTINLNSRLLPAGTDPVGTNNERASRLAMCVDGVNAAKTACN